MTYTHERSFNVLNGCIFMGKNPQKTRLLACCGGRGRRSTYYTTKSVFAYEHLNLRLTMRKASPVILNLKLSLAGPSVV